MPIFFTTDPLGCVIQCGDHKAGGGLYLAVLATGARGGQRPVSAPVVRRRRGQIFRQLDGARRVQLMHFDVDRWRIRVIGEAGTVGSVTERVLARNYVLEETGTAYG